MNFIDFFIIKREMNHNTTIFLYSILYYSQLLVANKIINKNKNNLAQQPVLSCFSLLNNKIKKYFMIF